MDFGASVGIFPPLMRERREAQATRASKLKTSDGHFWPPPPVFCKSAYFRPSLLSRVGVRVALGVVMLVAVFLVSALLSVYPLTAWDWKSFATMSAISVSPLLVVWTFFVGGFSEITDAGGAMFYGLLLLGTALVMTAIAGRLITLSLQSAFAWPRYLTFPLEVVPALSLAHWLGLWRLG